MRRKAIHSTTSRSCNDAINSIASSFPWRSRCCHLSHLSLLLLLLVPSAPLSISNSRAFLLPLEHLPLLCQSPFPASSAMDEQLAPQSGGLLAVHRSPALAPIKALAPLPSAQPAASTATGAAATSSATEGSSNSSSSGAPPSLSLTDGASSSTDAGDLDDGAPPKGEHALHQSWTFWYDVSDGKAKEWGASLKKLLEFNSIEQFWGMYNNIARPSALPLKSDYHVFRYGIKPEWEDPQNRNGGKWVWEMKREGAELDQGWIATVRHKQTNWETAGDTIGISRAVTARKAQELLFLIGEQFSDESEVLGVVVSLRKGRNKLAVWTRTSSNRDALIRVGTEWRKVLQLSNAVKLAFYSHAQTMKRHAGEIQPIFQV